VSETIEVKGIFAHNSTKQHSYHLTLNLPFWYQKLKDYNNTTKKKSNLVL